jgi:ABC-2 type transport system permease protein
VFYFFQFMRAHLSVFSARFRLLLQYRAAAWAGFGTQTFWGLIRVMIFTGFFASTTKAQPLNFAQTMSYIWLGQALFALIPFREDPEIATLIRTGNIAYEMVRPVNLYWFWFVRQIAGRTAPVLLRAIPMVLTVAIGFPMLGIERWALHPPASIFSFWCFLLSVLAAVVLASTFSMIMTISLLWTISADGVSNLFPALILSLCGIIVPLPFFPDWMQPILRVLPFRGIMDVPFQIYIGTILPHAAIWEVGRQCLWIGGLVLFSRYLLDKGVKRVVVQGG